jgi:hypothetical protein
VPPADPADVFPVPFTYSDRNAHMDSQPDTDSKSDEHPDVDTHGYTHCDCHADCDECTDTLIRSDHIVWAD